ncbi:hypothetical protein J3R30DRAFT_3709690 [Lentinula aciculospora]|uniref:WKF domain-containing protein n=1 Tax=Lentinula aciculospora TaxID=153920 RepID=A0A9W9A1C8_9AGAR|nr:hypothetical protein J3R30DRAFT_3709690 [Lentinula aciculospora]
MSKNVSVETPEKKQKEKKLKSNLDSQTAEKNVGPVKETKKKSKKDRKNTVDDELEVGLEGRAGSVSYTREKPESETVTPEEEVILEKKKKRKERRRDTETDPEGAPIERKKRKRDESENAEAEDLPQTNEGGESKKKKARNNTGFPDPAEEASLSPQARKSLAYAFMQFRKPSKWKFMKARQNWIIRNWATENIPDSHMPLVLKYISNIKGNVRENLTKACESIISTEAPAQISVVTEKTRDQKEEDDRTQPTRKTDSIKLSRAEAILAMLINEAESD